MNSPQKFDQFHWMRAWLADGLSTHAVAVLAVIFSHLRPDGGAWRAWPSITTISSQAGCSRKTAIKYIAEVEAAGWIQKSGGDGRSTTYTATYPDRQNQPENTLVDAPNRCTGYTGTGVSHAQTGVRDTLVTSVSHASTGVSQDRTGVSHAQTGVRDTLVTSVSHASTGVSQDRTGVSHAQTGVRGTPEQHKNSKEQPLTAAASTREPAAENEADFALDDEAAEIQAIFKIEGHVLTDGQADRLKTHIEKYQPSALRYIEARLIDDRMGQRFGYTRPLLAALRADAINDGAAVYGRRGHPDDQSPGAPQKPTQTPPEPDPEPFRPPGPDPDTYEPPAAWSAAQRAISGQISTRNFNDWIRPIRAETTPDGLRLWCPDEFAAMWVRDNFNDVISTALGGLNPTYGPLSSTPLTTETGASQ